MRYTRINIIIIIITAIISIITLNYIYMCFQKSTTLFLSYQSYLFGIEFVELCLAVVASPQTENFGFGAVCHIDQFLIPPTITDGTSYTP